MNWIKDVEQASNMETLLQVVNDFILEQPDEHWSWLPVRARPTLVGTEQDLHDWNHRLAHELATATNPNLRMQDLVVFFLRASARAHQLNLEPPSPAISARPAHAHQPH